MPRARRGHRAAIVALLLAVAACSGQDGPDDAGSGALEDGDLEEAEAERELHPDEWAETLATCMREQGFPVEIARDGGLDFSQSSDEQAPLVAAAFDSCEERFPLEERFTAPLDGEQIAMVYRHQVEVLLPCLRDLGHEPADPPSEEAYIAAYGSGEPWDPFPGIVALSREEYYTVHEECSWGPAADDLFPEG